MQVVNISYCLHLYFNNKKTIQGYRRLHFQKERSEDSWTDDLIKTRKNDNQEKNEKLEHVSDLLHKLEIITVYFQSSISYVTSGNMVFLQRLMNCLHYVTEEWTPQLFSMLGTVISHTTNRRSPRIFCQQCVHIRLFSGQSSATRHIENWKIFNRITRNYDLRKQLTHLTWWSDMTTMKCNIFTQLPCLSVTKIRLFYICQGKACSKFIQ